MLKRDSGDSASEEVPVHVGRSLEELPAEDRASIETALEPETPVKEIIISDILPSGVYGKNYIVRSTDRLIVVVDRKVIKELRYDEIAEIFNRDFVGNGVLEARSPDGTRIEVTRYSRTLSDAIEELVRNVSFDMGKSDDELVESREVADRISGPKQEAATYRCPSCGYPLVHQGDVCPRCSRNNSFVFKVLKYLKPHVPLVVAGSITSLVVTVANLMPGFLVRMLVDNAIMAENLSTDGKLRTLLFVCLVFLGFILIRMVTQFFRIKIMGTLGTKVVRALRVDTYRALQRLSLSYYDSELTGRIMARVLGDTQQVQGFVVNALQTALINVLMITGIAVTLFVSNWRLALIALGPVPIVIGIGRYFSRRFKGIFRSVRRKYSSLSGAVAESVTGVRVVKSFAQEEQEFEQFESKNRDFYEAQISAVQTRAKFQPAVIFAMTVGTIVVWFVGGSQVVGGALTLGLLLQFITYMNQFYAPIQMLINLTETYQASGTAAERVFSIMSMPSEVQDHDRAADFPETPGKIELKDVSFSYQTGERILKNVNLTIEPGSMIGIVGQTGSGKSTLVSLICRFYDPTSGTITIGDTDLRDISTHSLRNSIGLVLQDTFLFARTIKENIAYGNPGVSDRQIIDASKAANAHEFIMNLPDAYDNEVGERGVTLSGGEKQRISIARAILKDPKILILDEATSAVDSATEASIQEAMDRLVHGRTTIAIAHRLSTLRNADQLIVIHNGEIVENGTHEELMRKGGVYEDLVQKQAGFAREMIG